jgi:hypothetical protein
MTNPTYNFYNCCCPTTNLDCDENNTNYAGSIFPIKTTGGGLWANWRDGDVDSANRFIPVNFVDTPKIGTVDLIDKFTVRNEKKKI